MFNRYMWPFFRDVQCLQVLGCTGAQLVVFNPCHAPSSTVPKLVPQFVPRYQSFYSRRLQRMLRGKLNWKRQVFSILFLCFDFELRTPTTWHGFVVAVGLMNTCTTESPTCLANHEARARTHQTEEEYKELQVGLCV